MSKKNGTSLMIYVDVSSTPTPIAGSTENSMSVNGETIDVTTKDSLGWKEILPGLRSWGFKGSGKFDDAASFGFSDLFAMFLAGVAVQVRFSFEDSGDPYWYGEAVLTSLELTAPMEKEVTFSYSLEGSEAPAEGTI